MASLAPASSEFVEVLRRGLEAYDAGEMERASQLFDEALEIEPDNVWGLLWKGATSPTVGESKMWLEQAIAIDPHNEHARAGLRWANDRLSSNAEDTDTLVGVAVADTPDTAPDDTLTANEAVSDESYDWLTDGATATAEEAEDFSTWLEEVGAETQDEPVATDRVASDDGLSFADDSTADDLSDAATVRELDDLLAMDMEDTVTDPTDTLFDAPTTYIAAMEEDSETVPPPSTSELPDWLSRGAEGAEDDTLADTPTSTTEDDSNVLNWMPDDDTPTTSTNEVTLPDWLTADMGADLEEAAEEGQAVPTWLNENTDAVLEADLSQAAELPDWLNDESPAATQEDTLPDWLTGEDDTSAVATEEVSDWLTGEEVSDEATTDGEDVSDWLTRDDADVATEEDSEPSSNGTAAAVDLPDWLLGESTTEDSATNTATTEEADLPDWLTGVSDASAEDTDALPDWLTGGTEDTTAVQEDDSLPDWLTGTADTEADSSTTDELPSWLTGEEDSTFQPSRSTGSIAASNDVAEAYQTGLWAYEEDRLEDATVAFQRVIRLDSTHVEAHNYLGSVFYLNGRPDDAIAALRRALELDPNHSESYLNLGLVYKETGRNGQAAQMFRRYLDLAPEDDSTRQYVQEMIDQLGA